MRVPLLLLSVALLSGIGATSPRARAATSTREHAIRPMPPEDLRRLVSVPPEALPEGVRFAGAQVDRTSILVRYVTPDGQVRVRLSHPMTSKGDLHSGRFALRLDDSESARMPMARVVLEALHRHLASHEDRFHWSKVGTSTPESQNLPSRFPRLRDWIPWAYLALIMVLFVMGPWLNHRRHRTSPPMDIPARAWDRWDTAAMTLIALFAVVMTLPTLHLPLSCDEATNLELDFWSGWFWYSESSRHPPLFRLIIHATATSPEPSALMRAPPVLFALLALWLFFRLARERGPALAAFLALVALATSTNFWLWAPVQKSLTLWLCLLLAAHADFARAISGDRRRFARFSLWAMLACLTHYLSVAYLGALFLFALYHQRDRWRDHLIALLPAALVTAPLALPMVLSQVSSPELLDGVATNRHVFAVPLIGTGLVWLCLASLAVLLHRTEGRRETSLLFMILVGLGVTLGVGQITGTAARYFYPLIPLGLLYLVGRLRLRPDRRRVAQMALLILAGVFWLVGAAINGWAVHRTATREPLFSRYLALTTAAPGERAPHVRVVLVQPPCFLPVIGHQITGARPRPETLIVEKASEPGLHMKGRWWLALRSARSTAPLDRLLLEVGAFDVLWHEQSRKMESSPVGRWLLHRCKTLYRSPHHWEPHPQRLLRCLSDTPAPLDPRPGLWQYHERDRGPTRGVQEPRHPRQRTAS